MKYCIVFISLFLCGCVSDEMLMAEYGELACEVPVVTPINLTAVEYEVVEEIQQTKTYASVFFDFSKSNLTDKSKLELDFIAQELINNPLSKAYLVGHTDKVGQSKYNFALSMKRVKSVSRYLQNKGINVDRILGIGLGEGAPIQAPDLATDELNRRVEVLVFDEQKIFELMQ
ncbi:OmpA family protein [Shewanella marina]|uniref:OmpA family protein n=1 Tax=Shewanella marina TaxID=487319 RepID=UPI00046F431B|nr:OmpA family protein [Shewanella marina]